MGAGVCECVHYNSLRPPTNCSSRQRSHGGCQPRSTESQVMWAPAPREASTDSTPLRQPLSPHCGRTHSAASAVRQMSCTNTTQWTKTASDQLVYTQLLRHVALLALAALRKKGTIVILVRMLLWKCAAPDRLKYIVLLLWLWGHENCY